MTENEWCTKCDMFYICVIRVSKNCSDCPCFNCLIKMRCSVSCPERDNLVSIVLNKGYSLDGI